MPITASLCGIVTLTPTKPIFGKGAHDGFQVIGLRHIYRDVVPGQSVSLQPVSVKRGRSAMGNRRSDHPGQRNPRIAHPSIIPLQRQVTQKLHKGEPEYREGNHLRYERKGVCLLPR
jgi:hypothetical protein